MTTDPSLPSPGERWHERSAADVLSEFRADAEGGLTSTEVQGRLGSVGPNELPQAKSRGPIVVFLQQFQSPLIYLLFAAAAIALSLGERRDAGVIFAVVLINAIIGAFQEGRAESSLAALRDLTKPTARVLREGRSHVLPGREVVPGDILLVEAGDAVVADARLVEAASLRVAEAALTGESVPVSKRLDSVPSDTPLADRFDMVYAGTLVTSGRGHAVVVATGLDTEIGHIATLAQEAEEPKTPLEKRIARFGRHVIVAAAVMFVLVIAVGWLRGTPFGVIVMVGISQVVGMIPEGLPIAMTIALSVGVQRMARRRAVVRRLAAVETLGSTTVICTDKTGTLTQNEMTATAVHLPTGRQLSVSGAGYRPDGEFCDEGGSVDPSGVPELEALLVAGVLCNDARLHPPADSSDDREGEWRAVGDPTETALLTLAHKAGVLVDELRRAWPRRDEVPFDAATRVMATEHEGPSGRVVYLKGAPEVVLDFCSSRLEGTASRPWDEMSSRVRVTEVAERMAARALRVLAFARIDDQEIRGQGLEGLGKGAVFLGLVGQLDPPRREVADAVSECRAAGIRPVMVTGDHRVTGEAIARDLGIAHDGDSVLDGRALERMSDADLAERAGSVSVFARVQPDQKLRIVRALQDENQVVAMTGDGVNDAPALVRANVGVAMGKTGTEVAKEASAIVVTDDNFATIVAAVEEGRLVYRNLKKVILYLLSTSMAEVLVLFLALVLGHPPPLAAVQILWINLVTESAVTVNLVMDPREGDEMKRPPVPLEEPLLSRNIVSRMLFMTPAITASTLGWFIVRLSSGAPFDEVQTETFTVLAVCQWFNVLNCRSAIHSALNFRFLENRWLVGGLLLGNLLQAAVVFLPPLNRMFHTVPISFGEFLAIGAVASLVLWVEELRKLVVRLRRRQNVDRSAHVSRV